MNFVKNLLIRLICLQTLTMAYGTYDFCTNFAPFKEALKTVKPPQFKSNQNHEDALSKLPTITNDCEEIFDFVIVGSGPAGSVIANRLSENPDWQILLLEIGEIPINTTDIVAKAGSFQSTDYNWAHVTEPQDNAALGLRDRIMNLPRGRVLGGSTTINACVHSRGNRKDYDRWAEAGNTGWSFQDVLPHFKKSEDFLVQIQDPEYHRQGGLLGVQDVPYRSGSSKAFVDSMLESGYDYVDYNGRQQMGVSFVHGTLRRGRRSGAFNAFLQPFSYRENLRVYTGARATQILIDPRGKRAYGVKYDKDGQSYNVYAQKEVILSAGSFSSPELLMLSGVGPKEQLEEVGIPVIHDLPGVGQNLADHAILHGITFTLNESITLPYHEIGVNEQHMEDFYNGEGLLTTLTGAEALGHVKTPYTTNPDPTVPDVVLIFLGTSNNIGNGTGFKQYTRVRDDIYDAIWGQIPDRPAASIIPMLYHAKSRGYIQLKSNSPYDVPLFHGNYFSDPNNDDIKVMISAIRVIQQLIKMPAWQRYDAQLVEAVIPGCEAHEYDTDEYWECFLRHIGTTSNHHVGTCKMGPAWDPEAVVGPDLKVRGILGLRVADSSVMPDLVAGHTSIPTFMVGEKAAAMIKECWMED